jgi:sugar phosphate isomerase/epimerase
MKLADFARPGLMISQTWPDSRETPGKTLRAIELGVREDFFEAFQTVDVPDAAERCQIAAALRGTGATLTYCIGRLLNEGRLNLSDLSEPARAKAVECVRPWLDHAREAGAEKFLLLGGKAPAEEERRQAALVQLEKSLVSICRDAHQPPPLQVVIEPLDVWAHKKSTLGFTEEALRLVCSLPPDCGLGLCLDTSHLLLNEEDPALALRLTHSLVREFHFCNCVSDRGHPLFGDLHLPFGPPGRIGVEEVASLMTVALEVGFFSKENRPSIFCEILTRERESVTTMKDCRTMLEDAWRLTCGS